MRPAPRGERIGSLTLDLSIITAMAVGFMMVFLRLLSDPTRPDGDLSLMIFGFVVGVPLCGWLYAMMCQILLGATLGKCSFGLVVVDRHGARVGMIRASARILAAIVFTMMMGPLLYLVVFLADCDQRALHDRLTGSYVACRST